MDAVIVWGSIVLVAAFVVAWYRHPRLKARVEQPKYRFQTDVDHYDRLQYEKRHGHSAPSTKS